MKGKLLESELMNRTLNHHVQMQMAPTPVHGSLTPMLGGSETPLVGDRKVEVMMGITREHARSNVDKSMPPPPRRNFRK